MTRNRLRASHLCPRSSPVIPTRRKRGSRFVGPYSNVDEGHSENLTALLKTMARFTKYSWHNVALIASQTSNHHTCRWVSDLAQDGCFVRKGEKGIAILAPIVGRRGDGESKTVLQGRPRVQ